MTENRDDLVKVFDDAWEAVKFSGSKSSAGYGEDYYLTKEEVQALLDGKYVSFTGREYGAVIFSQYSDGGE